MPSNMAVDGDVLAAAIAYRMPSSENGRVDPNSATNKESSAANRLTGEGG